MADTTETPPTAPKKPAAPATRRRAPRKDAAPKPTPKPTPAHAPAAPTAAKRAPAPKAPKPRSTKRATPKPAGRKSTAASPAKSLIARATGKVGGKWGATAIAGGIAAIGALAAAALLSLRGSTRKGTMSQRGAHTADGQDASKSFAAGIADENSIPSKD